MLSYKDFTLKAHLKNRIIVEQKLMDLGAILVGEDYQHDYYFKISNGKLKYRKGTLGSLITHYERFVASKAEKTQVYRYDPNPSDEEVQQLFDQHKLIGEIQKIRRIYQFKNSTIHLDTLSNGEVFVEIEAKDFNEQSSDESLQAQCWDIFAQLSISKDDVIPTGYMTD